MVRSENNKQLPKWIADIPWDPDEEHDLCEDNPLLITIVWTIYTTSEENTQQRISKNASGINRAADFYVSTYANYNRPLIQIHTNNLIIPTYPTKEVNSLITVLLCRI